MNLKQQYTLAIEVLRVRPVKGHHTAEELKDKLRCEFESLDSNLSEAMQSSRSKSLWKGLRSVIEGLERKTPVDVRSIPLVDMMANSTSVLSFEDRFLACRIRLLVVYFLGLTTGARDVDALYRAMQEVFDKLVNLEEVQNDLIRVTKRRSLFKRVSGKTRSPKSIPSLIKVLNLRIILGKSIYRRLDIKLDERVVEAFKTFTVRGNDECVVGHQLLVVDQKLYTNKMGDNKTYVYDVDANVVVTTFDNNGADHIVEYNSRLYASSHQSSVITIFDTDAYNVVGNLHCATAEGIQTTIINEGLLFAAAFDHNTVIVWDLANSAEIHCIEGHTPANIHSLAVYNNALYCDSIDGSVVVYDAKTYAHICTMRTGTTDKITSMVVYEGVLCVAAGPTIVLFDTTTNEKVDILEGHRDAITFLQIHCNRLYSCSLDNTVRDWDLCVSNRSLLNTYNCRTVHGVYGMAMMGCKLYTASRGVDLTYV